MPMNAYQWLMVNRLVDRIVRSLAKSQLFPAVSRSVSLLSKKSTQNLDFLEAPLSRSIVALYAFIYSLVYVKNETLFNNLTKRETKSQRGTIFRTLIFYYLTPLFCFCTPIVAITCIFRLSSKSVFFFDAENYNINELILNSTVRKTKKVQREKTHGSDRGKHFRRWIVKEIVFIVILSRLTQGDRTKWHF